MGDTRRVTDRDERDIEVRWLRPATPADVPEQRPPSDETPPSDVPAFPEPPPELASPPEPEYATLIDAPQPKPAAEPKWPGRTARTATVVRNRLRGVGLAALDSPEHVRRARRVVRAWGDRPVARLLLPVVLIVAALVLAGAGGAYLVPKLGPKQVAA